MDDKGLATEHVDVTGGKQTKETFNNDMANQMELSPEKMRSDGQFNFPFKDFVESFDLDLSLPI